MLDSKGFKRPTHSELLSEMQQEARNRYGDDVNTSERSFLGIILRIFSWFLSKVWQDSENTYNSAYVNTAEGVQLDRLGPYVGIQRNLATWSNGTIEITGTPNYTVPAGFLVSTDTEVSFQTLEDITLNSEGKGLGDIQALEPGTSGNVGANTITVINNPIVDVTSVTNPERTAGGQDKETDPEFRERFAQSIAGGGAATIDALRSALLSTSNVRAASIVENDSMEVVEGRPPKSFEAYCLGGDAQDIAKTILSTKAAGIETYGSESVQVPDLSGQMHTIKFSFAEEVNVHIRATVTRDNRYPVDGNQSIKTALIRYIGGEDASGQIYAGLNMGESVVHARLIAAAFGIEGVTDVKIEVSTDGVSWSESNISIGIHQVAQTAYTIIEVQS